MEIELRDNEGTYLCGFTGSFAKLIYEDLLIEPKFEKTTLKIKNKGEFVVLKALVLCGYRFRVNRDSFVEIVIPKDGYVRIC